MADALRPWNGVGVTVITMTSTVIRVPWEPFNDALWTLVGVTFVILLVLAGVAVIVATVTSNPRRLRAATANDIPPDQVPAERRARFRMQARSNDRRGINGSTPTSAALADVERPESSWRTGVPLRLLDAAEELAHSTREPRDSGELRAALGGLTAALESLANTSLQLSLATRSLGDGDGADGRPMGRPGGPEPQVELVMRLLFAVSQNLRLARQISEQARAALAMPPSAA
jgi:hypothetical protein